MQTNIKDKLLVCLFNNDDKLMMKFSNQFKLMEEFISNLQKEICSALELQDVVKFSEDIWKRNEGGGGKTKVIQNGKIFEKGGVNISSVYGELPEILTKQFSVEKSNFAACGISLVIHPFTPKIPTIHMNVRYFEMENGKSWFGGGIDLTPYYPYPEDFVYFHKVMREACESVMPNSYSEFKKECDEYFTIKHRNEMRGIGGIFFDYKDGTNKVYFDLVQSTGNAFLKCYLPIIEKRKNEIYSEEDKMFQSFRRGRYVEFNLIYDRGTLFGLKTGGRTESILMSLPPEVKFPYNYQPKQGSPQEEMVKFYQPQNWIL